MILGLGFFLLQAIRTSQRGSDETSQVVSQATSERARAKGVS